MTDFVYTHDPACAPELDLEAAIRGHSGDRTEVYKRALGEPISLSYFYPPERAATPAVCPTIVMIHGGGWAGRKIFADQRDWAGDYLGFLARRYANKGFLCVSVDYRRMTGGGQADGLQMIDLYEDCVDALAHIAAHGARDGLDARGVTVLGESAGGHLAAALATFSPRALPLPLKAAVLVNPVTDLRDPVWGKYAPETSTHPLLRDLSPDERRAYLSPLCRLTKDACPAMLLHGKADSVVAPRQAEDYHRAMLEHGRLSELHWLEGANHAFLLAEYYPDRAATCAAIAALDEYLLAP